MRDPDEDKYEFGKIALITMTKVVKINIVHRVGGGLVDQIVGLD